MRTDPNYDQQQLYKYHAEVVGGFVVGCSSRLNKAAIPEAIFSVTDAFLRDVWSSSACRATSSSPKMLIKF